MTYTMITVILSAIGLLTLAALFIAVVVRNFWPDAAKPPHQRKLEAIARERARALYRYLYGISR